MTTVGFQLSGKWVLLVVVFATALLVWKRDTLAWYWQDLKAQQLQNNLASQMLAQVYEAHSGQVEMPYRLFVPEHSKDSDAVYPIILALHSGAGRGSDNLRQLDRTIEILLSKQLQGIEPVFVLAPQAKRWTHWVNYDKFTPPFENFSQQEIPQSDNLKTAINILRHVIEQYPIDPRRVYITGISMGGEGSWDAVCYYPDLFAAAIILNGAADPHAVANTGQMPIRFFHGDRDTITPVKNSREINDSISQHNKNAQYKELKGAGHNIRDRVYSPELFSWLLKQHH